MFTYEQCFLLNIQSIELIDSANFAFNAIARYIGICGGYLSQDAIQHYIDVIMSGMASPIISVSIVYSTVCSGVDQRKILKLRVTGLCAGNSPVTGHFPAQRASNSENVSIGWRHHELPSSVTHWGLSRPYFNSRWLRRDCVFPLQYWQIIFDSKYVYWMYGIPFIQCR